MSQHAPFTQKSPLPSVLEENEDVPPPPPHPYFFVFPEQLFGGWPFYTSGAQSFGSSIRNSSYRKSWGPDRYFQYGNDNGTSAVRNRHHSADDLDGQDNYSQFDYTQNSFGDGSRGQGQGGWACFKALLLLLAFLLVFCGMALFALHLQSYCESPSNVDNLPNFQGGKTYCTCECEDLLDLFALRNYYQSQEQINAMMQRQRIERRV